MNKQRLCMMCQVSHIKGNTPSMDMKHHCMGEMGANCDCDCKRVPKSLKLYEDLNQAFRASQERGLIR